MKSLIISIVICSSACASTHDGLGADFNEDGIVNAQDYAILCAHMASYDSRGDIFPQGGDGVIDGRDLLALLADWLVSKAPITYLQADYSHDGIVNFNDFGVLAANWQIYAPTVNLVDACDVGFVDGHDLMYFAESWLEVLPATWYVDGVNGNDLNAGTEMYPWQTVARAQTNYVLKQGQSDKVRDGDTVVIMPGNYGNFIENTSHLRRVTYRGQGKDAVLNKIQLGSRSAQLRFENMWVQSQCYLRYTEGIELIDCKLSYPQRRFDAPVNVVDVSYASDILLEHCEIANCKTAVEGTKASNIKLLFNYIHGVLVDAIELITSNDVIIQGNHITEVQHDRKIFKSLFSEPMGFVPAAAGVLISDAAGYDMKIAIPDSNVTGLIAICVLADINECGSYTGLRDFGQIKSLEVGVKPSMKLYSKDLAVRICSEPDCNSGIYEDILLDDYDNSDSNSANWEFVSMPANQTTLMGMSELYMQPHYVEYWDRKAVPPVLMATLRRGYDINRFSPYASSPLPARSIGIVLKVNRGPGQIAIEASNGFVFSNGNHQDIVAGSGKGWLIKDNIMHDAIGQGIFNTGGYFVDMQIEQNLMYDIQGATLVNATLGGESSFCYNTMVGYIRTRTNGGGTYSPFSSSYFLGNASVKVADANSNMAVYNNLIGGSLHYPLSDDSLPWSWWDYNITQTVTCPYWGFEPWPMYSGVISKSGTTANFNDFFIKSEFGFGHHKTLDFNLQSSSGKWPWPVYFGTAAMKIPAKGLGSLDERNEFILDNGVERNPEHISVGAYEFAAPQP